MPAVAVAGAAAAWSAVSTVGVLTAIGATVAAIGSLTGNKNMTMIGGAMSLVGGVSSLANAGAAGAESAAGATGEASKTVAEQGITDAASQTSSVSTPTANMPEMSLQSANTVKPATGMIGTDTSRFGGTTNLDSITDAMYASGDGGSAIDPNNILKGGFFGEDSTVKDLTSGNMKPAPSMMDKFLTFSRENSNLMNNGVQLLGGAMQGEFKQKELDLTKDLVDMKRQRQTWGNSVPNITGMIGRPQ